MQSKTKHEYVVNVGNIGAIKQDNLKAAYRTFNHYTYDSVKGYGRCAGESVVMMIDGEIHKEHIGSKYK